MSLQAMCTPASLAAAFTAHGAFPFPADRLPATAAAGRRLELATAAARRALATPWEALTAQGYLRYSRDGNRSEYERPYFQRRRRIGAFALAWAATREDAFAAAAADGIWLACEESTWCVPAHVRHQVPASERWQLVAPGATGYIDLFNCETAQCLAEACQLLGPALAAIDPSLAQRAAHEIRRRVIDPLLAGATPWWLGGDNNWSVWCASSVIAAAGFACAAEPATWGRIAHEMLGVVDRYVAKQGADGGCDEGVMYWNVAGGCVLRAIEEVRARTGGQPDPWRAEPKLGEIMRFPVRMHLGAGCFPAFADGGPRSRPAGGVLALAAALVAAPELLAMAQALSDPAFESDPLTNGVGDLLQMQLRALWWLDTAAPAPAAGLADAWLPDLQVVVAHGGGTALAAKGGHNAENHNHNDIGQFVIHRHGVPLLVDAGRGEYTAQTFGPKRYDLWWTSGAGHAVPVIDGHQQLPGHERAARAVARIAEGGCTGIALDLAASYPAEAGLRRLERRVTLDRSDGRVELSDQVDAGRPVAYALALLATAEPRRDGDGWIVARDGQALRIRSQLVGSVEAVALDAGLRSSWDGLWRLTLRGTLAAGDVVRIAIDPIAIDK